MRFFSVSQGGWAAGTLPALPSLLLAGMVSLFAFPTLGSVEVESDVEKPGPVIDWGQEQQFWSFRAPVAQARPKVKNTRWPRQPLDFHLLARLEQAGLSPSLEADRRTLIRRLTFDLTGLPPAPGEVEAFLKDRRPEADERLVDRLLASTRFGERMASLWLPLARYAEDQAHQVGTDTKFFYPNAYKYRAWTIAAFNRDLPYDQFLRLQLAADKFPGTAPSDLRGLGFLGLGPKYYNRNRIEVMADEWEDRVDTVSRTMLGLTVACARCHDHKFEPITMRDYYGLAGVFASTKMVNRSGEGDPAKAVKAEKEGKDGKPDKSDKVDPTILHMVEDGETQDLHVFLRGNVERKGPLAERRFLRILSRDEPERFSDGSGRRELAEAIADPRNPLTARVMVNRVWAEIFGSPLVGTPSNFGHSGMRPTHPELLDDLAVRFMARNWSVKQLVRELVLSAAYRQRSLSDEARAAQDPANELFWRMNRRRLSIEQWRDAALFVSGELEWTNGPSLELDNPENRRRTVYARVSRLKLNDMLMQFDYPDANVHAEHRAVTTTPMQKLFLLNNRFALGRARALAARLSGAGLDQEAGIRRAYEVLFAREPIREELETGLHYLNKPTPEGRSRWEEYAQALLASNEMFYVD